MCCLHTDAYCNVSLIKYNHKFPALYMCGREMEEQFSGKLEVAENNIIVLIMDHMTNCM